MEANWLPKDRCTGCGVCANICAHNAITMKNDEYGFLHPSINENCIQCGQCKKICENRKKQQERFSEPRTFAAWSRDNDLRYCSTSGGVFSELAKVVLTESGSIVGAVFDEENLVYQTIVNDKAGLERIRQSKYVQSDSKVIYRQVKGLLLEGKNVLFCGTPCQVAALYSFLGKEYKKLITVDFICRGVNSPKAYLSWLKEIEEQRQDRVSKVWFKYKINGWKNSPRCTRLDFCSGSNLVVDKEDNLYMQGYLGPNLYIRPSCGECEFKGVPRKSDITLADFWGIDASLDDDKGTSLVMVNSECGMQLINRAATNLELFERNFSEIFKGNECFSGSVEIPPESKDFLKALDDMKFSSALRKFTEKKEHCAVDKPSMIVLRIKQIIKRILSIK